MITLDYLINPTVLYEYEKIYMKSIERNIKKMVNKHFIFRDSFCELSLSFYEDFIIIIKIENGTITELVKYSYENFIPDSFLKKITEIDELPSRLNRYKSLDYSRFRNEIKESLKDGKIKLDKNNDAFWRDYNIVLKIDGTISFTDIVI